MPADLACGDLHFSRRWSFLPASSWCQLALQAAVSEGGADSLFLASVHQVRAYALRLLHELPASCIGTARLLGAVATALLSSAAKPEQAFPKAGLHHTLGARRHLRTWQALTVIGPRLAELTSEVRAAAEVSRAAQRSRALPCIPFNSCGQSGPCSP